MRPSMLCTAQWEDSGMDGVYGAREACESIKKHSFEASKVAFDSAIRTGEAGRQLQSAAWDNPCFPACKCGGFRFQSGGLDSTFVKIRGILVNRLEYNN